MGPTESQIPPVKKKPSSEDRLTIMIIRSLGRVRSFKISPHIVFWTLLFFIVYIPFSVFIINKSVELYRTNRTQSEKIAQLEKDVIRGQKTLARFRQHVTLLEDYIRHIEDPQKAKSAAASDENTQQRTVVSDVEDLTKDTEEEKRPVGSVDIKDMVIQKEGTRMNVAFKLVNMNPGETAVGGYIHMIAVGNDPSPPPEWTFPRVQLDEGIPTNFRRGQLFLIQRFKPVQGRFSFDPHSEPPTALKVLVYDQSGVLILQREFEVSHVS